MRSLVYYVASTLDGFIAAPDGTFDFFGLPGDLAEFITTSYPETLPTAYREAVGIDAPAGRFDTVVMGRNTYQPALDQGITSPYAHLEQFVVSTTLPDGDGVTVIRTDPAGFVRELKQKPGRDIWLCGGGDLAGRLAGEIDELVIKLNPVLAGSGIPLIRRDFAAQALTLTDSRALPSGVVLLTYRVQ